MSKISLIIIFIICCSTVNAQFNHHHPHHHHHQHIPHVADTVTRILNLEKTIYCRVSFAALEPLSCKLDIGYIFNKKHDLGIGGGVDFYPRFYGRFSGEMGVLYSKYNYYFLKKRNTPFVSIALGYGWVITPEKGLNAHFAFGEITERGGAYTQIGFAYKIRTTKSLFAMCVGLYYSYQHYEYHEHTIYSSLQGGGLHLNETSGRTVDIHTISDNHNLIFGLTIGLR